MEEQKFYTFPDIYEAWYDEKYPKEEVVVHKSEGESYPGIGDTRNKFDSFLLQLNARRSMREGRNFKFNEDGRKLLLMFLTRSREKEFKNIRRGEFTPEDTDLYDEILALIVSNMRALGFSQREIDMQTISFWSAVCQRSDSPVEFLTGLKRLFTPDEICEFLPEHSNPTQFYENLYYINEVAKESFAVFQESWHLLMKLYLALRQEEINAITSELDASEGLYESIFAVLLKTLPEYSDVLDSDDPHLAVNRERLKADMEFEKKARGIFTTEKIIDLTNRFSADELTFPSKPWELYTRALLQLSRHAGSKKSGK